MHGTTIKIKNNHIQHHYNKFTNRCCYKIPLTASHVTYSKQISIQQSAVRICDGTNLPTVTDVRYIIMNRDRQQGYKRTTPVVTIHTTCCNNNKPYILHTHLSVGTIVTTTATAAGKGYCIVERDCVHFEVRTGGLD
jgi:hypothetical protein